MSKNYTILRKAGMSMDYLHANSTTHGFIFGALAEIVDNSRDADASYLKINAIDRPDLRGGFMLQFLDDGHGMDPEECSDTLIFGVSNKKAIKNMEHIGKYGNGLKSSTLRIANDFMLFTKKNNILSISFLSRTFYDEEGINKTDVYIAVPSFYADDKDKRPWFDINVEDEIVARERHELELKIILKYSPFKTKKDLFAQFDKIDGSAGTLVVIFNMLLNDIGKPYLQIDREKNDIFIPNENDDYDDDEEIKELGFRPEERTSFRQYVSILYSNPKMKIYIENSKVRTRIMEQTLYLVRSYKFVTKSFKKKSEEDVRKFEKDVTLNQRQLDEANSIVRDLRARMVNLSREDTRLLSLKNKLVGQLTESLLEKKKNLEELKKTMKQEKHLEFKFGINLHNRSQSGFFIYNCHRLILMYKKYGRQGKFDPEYHGIVGLVDVPYSIMDPQHNKQSFADEGEYFKLKKALGEYLDQYIRDVKAEVAKDNMRDFWTEFGYLDEKSDIPSQEGRFIRKRFFKIRTILQCDQCLKWRSWPSVVPDIDKQFPDLWSCECLPGVKCSDPEKLIEIKQGEIRREEKRPQVALDLPPKSANGIKPAKINPLEIAKQNSARLELQKQQEQKNHQKALKSTQSSNRLSSSGSHNTESDANKDFAYQIINHVERERRKMSLKRKTKDDYSDDSLFENENSQKITDKSKKLIKKNKSKNSTLISSDEEENDDHEEIASYKKFKESSKKLNKPAIRIVTETEEQSDCSSSFPTVKSEPSDGHEIANDIDEAYLSSDVKGLVIKEDEYKGAFITLARKVKDLMRLVGDRKEFLECRDEVMLGFDFNKYITDQTTQNFEKELSRQVYEGVKLQMAKFKEMTKNK